MFKTRQISPFFQGNQAKQEISSTIPSTKLFGSEDLSVVQTSADIEIKMELLLEKISNN